MPQTADLPVQGCDAGSDEDTVLRGLSPSRGFLALERGAHPGLPARSRALATKAGRGCGGGFASPPPEGEGVRPLDPPTHYSENGWGNPVGLPSSLGSRLRAGARGTSISGDSFLCTAFGGLALRGGTGDGEPHGEPHGPSCCPSLQGGGHPGHPPRPSGTGGQGLISRLVGLCIGSRGPSCAPGDSSLGRTGTGQVWWEPPA